MEEMVRCDADLPDEEFKETEAGADDESRKIWRTHPSP
jgi:hypothetical protein